LPSGFLRRAANQEDVADQVSLKSNERGTNTMKTILGFLLSLIFVQSLYSQTLTVHKNDATSIDFQLSDIGTIAFSASTSLPMVVHQKDGTTTDFQLSQVDSITFSTSTAVSMTVHAKDGTTADFQLSQIDSITFSTSPTPPAGFTGNFLAWTGSDDSAHYFTLVRVDGQNGTVTNIGGSDYFNCLEYAPNGTLYGIGTDLHIINPVNGSTTKIGDFHYGSQDFIPMKGAAFSADGTLYVLASSDSAFTVNLSNAALTYVGKPSALVWDLEFAPNGTLYGAFGDLFTLSASDLSTITEIGPTGAYVSVLTLGNEGILFAMDIFPSTNIYSLNLSTGLATSITGLGSSGLRSLVAERTNASQKIAESHIAVKVDRFAAKRTNEELLDLERADRQSHSARLVNVKTQ
jgi:hypothetical protein